MNLKTTKLLGSGLVGDVLLCEFNGKPGIAKIERYNGDLTTSSTYIRQQVFDKYARKHPDRFLTLVFTGFQDDCKFKHKLPNYLAKDGNAIKLTKNNAKLNRCSLLVYKPVLKYTLEELLPTMTHINRFIIYKYLHKTLSIMDNEGFCHNDIHSRNVMCDASKKHWYLIDYGQIWHKDFEKNGEDDMPQPDVVMLAWCFIDNPVYDYMHSNQLDHHFDDFIERVSDSEEFKYIDSKVNHFENKVFAGDIIAIYICLKNYNTYIRGMNAENLPIGKKYMNYKHPNASKYISIIFKSYGIKP